jgi:hypothetical protein
MDETRNTEGITRHTCGGPVFGRKTPGCPRCDELLAGDAPRTSPKWEAVNRHREREAQDRRWYEAHRAEARLLGYCPTCQTPQTRTAVCTCFDW